jgi:hypothetical protein
MATFAALGKASAVSPLTAPVFQQDHFYVRQTRSSWSPRLYFQDDLGRTLAFVRNLSYEYSQEIRVFTDPTLSFELLAIKPVSHSGDAEEFAVTDSLTRELAGSIRHTHPARQARQAWCLLSVAAQETSVIQENSAFLAILRRYLTEFIPQGYTLYVDADAVGAAFPEGNVLARAMEIDLTRDQAKLVDRRLVIAAMVLIMAGKRYSGGS